MNFNIHIGLGDLLFTKNTLINLRMNGHNETFHFYIDTKLVDTYRNTYFGVEKKEAIDSLLHVANEILCKNDEYVTVRIGSGFTVFNAYSAFESLKLIFPILHSHCLLFPNLNEQIEFPFQIPVKDYITINTKCYDIDYEKWSKIKPFFLDIIHKINVNIVLLGDREYDDNNEYKMHNSKTKKIFVIYDEIKNDKMLDFTFQSKKEIIDVDILKRNKSIIHHSKLNITFSNGGAFYLNSFYGKTISYVNNMNILFTNYDTHTLESYQFTNEIFFLEKLQLCLQSLQST